jgi:hypothetical protein
MRQRAIFTRRFVSSNRMLEMNRRCYPRIFYRVGSESRLTDRTAHVPRSLTGAVSLSSRESAAGMNAPAAEIHIRTGMPKRSAAKPAIVGTKKPPTSSPTPMIKSSAVAIVRGSMLSDGIVDMDSVKQPNPVYVTRTSGARIDAVGIQQQQRADPRNGREQKHRRLTADGTVLTSVADCDAEDIDAAVSCESRRWLGLRLADRERILSPMRRR